METIASQDSADWPPVVTLGGMGIRIDRDRMYCTVCSTQVPVPEGESMTESTLIDGRRVLKLVPCDGREPVVHECTAPPDWRP